MKRVVLTHGGIAGAVIIVSMILSIIASGGGGTSEIFGYLIMLAALTLIFVGVKRYRDQDMGGLIRFSSAFTVGIGITLVASFIYVVAWEGYLMATDHEFIDQYTSAILEQKEAEGISPDAMAQEIEKMENMKTQYAKPWYRLPMTFLEIFPVGLLVSLISAGLLRNPGFLALRR